jgi:type III secretion system YscQ/HrcQ family protein
MKRLDPVVLDPGLLHCTAARVGGDEVLGLRLALETGGGDAGLALALQLEGAALTAWVDERSWLAWVEGVLPLPALSAAPPDLLPTLAAWTLAPLCEWLQREALPPPQCHDLRAAGLVRAPHWTLTLTRDGAALPLCLEGWPASWIAAVADRLQPLPAPPLALSLPLAAGWCHLSHAELGRLAPGDALLLSGAAEVEAGEVWLFQQRPLARLAMSAPDRCRVLTLMPADAGWSAAEPVAAGAGALAGLELCVVAELGRAMLDDVAALAVGTEATLALTSRVRLTLDGRRLADGELLRLGDRLAVRIRS